MMSSWDKTDVIKKYSHVEGGDGLPLSMFSVCDGVTDDLEQIPLINTGTEESWV